MSTILKALRRLEQDRSRDSQRPLREQVAQSPEPRRRRGLRWWVLGVFAAGLGLGAGALLMWPGALPEREGVSAPLARPAPTPQAPPVAARGPSSASAPSFATTPALAAPPAPEVATGRAALPSQALASEVEVVRRIAPPPLEMQEGDAAAPPRQPLPGEIRPGAEALKPKRARQLAARPTAPPAPAAAEGARPPAPAETARRRVQAGAPEPSAPAEAPAPTEKLVIPNRPPMAVDPEFPEISLRPPDLPPVAMRSPVPVLLVSRTHWHPAAERREALIEVESETGREQRSVREGDAVGPLVVRRIEPSAVLFEYEGVELRHAVGSAD